MKTKFTFRKWLGAIALFAVSIFSMGNGSLFAQTAASYGYTAVAGTFTEITGTAFTAVQSDDVLPAATIPLGFTFNYCGVDYTTIRAGSNGYMVFTTGAGQTAFNDATSLNTIKPALFWLWDDLDGATGSAVYTTTGTAPNRVFTFQYKNWEWNWSTAGPNISVQVKLYETTNVIEFVYRPESAAGNPLGSGGASIGICDGAATSTYKSLNNGTATATSSSTVFTANIGTKPPAGQIYRFTPPVNCSSSPTPLPTAGTVTATPASICLTGNVTLNFTPTTPFPPVVGISYKWQTSATLAGVYTDIPGAVTTAPTYTTTVPITANAYFKCVVLCNTTTTVLTSTASNQVVVTNPGTATGIPGSRCGPGTVPLSATGPAGTTLRWYEAATGGAPLFVGANFTTPYITATRNYYVTAGSAPMAGTATVGLGALTAGNATTPFFGAWGGYKHEYLILASELIAAGIAPGSTLNSAALDVISGGATYNGFSINLSNTNITAVTTTFQPGGPNIYGPVNYTPTAGLNTFTFTTPFIWTGGNLLIQTCWSNATFSNPYNYVTYDNTTFTSTHYGFGDGLTPTQICTAPPNHSTINQRPKFVFNYDGSCQGNRTAVLATVNPSTTVPKTAPAVVCNDAVATITLTPPAAPNNYSGYTWSPITNLYTNAAATTPYVAGANATTVYMKTTNVGQQTYYMMAGNPALTTGCTFADTVRIHVQPGNVTIKGQPDTICVSGTTTLSLDTIAGYFAGSIQWQRSTTGSNYTDIAGATSATYTTPPLTFGNNTYYKAVIKAGTAICQEPVKYVVVANPVIVNAPDSFHCGPGSVTLDVVTGGNGSAVWYENATGGLPIASGSPFVTPFLAATTSYWVSSGGGGSAGVQAVGAGALTTSFNSASPFVGGWGGRKHQYMIKASELIAAGIPPGANLTSLAFHVMSGAGTNYPGFTVSMKQTTVANLTGTFQTGMTQVKAPAAYTITAGVNTFTFDAPFPWDGTSNIIVQTCWSNATFNSPYGEVKYDNIVGANNNGTTYTQQDSQTPAVLCAATTGTTLTQRPQIILAYDNRCESARQEVIAYIRPQPVVDLGPNINKCVDAGAVEVLNAGVQPDVPSYLWDNGFTQQVRAITASGNYNVKVTNQFGCSGYDTIQVTLRPNPVVNLGNDTSVCNGVTLTLNAGNDGVDFFWNTGAVSQTINVNTAGSYNVFVTNGVACTKADTININMQGELPTIQGIAVNNNGLYTFQFSAINPQNVIGYEWDFGDNSLPSYAQSPTHTYPDAGNYIVVLKLSSSCGFKNDSTSAHIVGVNQLNVDNAELSVYPNPTKGQATILSKGALKMEKIEVYNILGQQVYAADADSKDRHNLDLDRLASGVYTIQVFTNKGNVARKLEILK